MVAAAKGAYTMFGIASRLVQAQQATNPIKHEDDEQRKAGRMAEEQFEELLKKLGGIPGYNIFKALRVPDEFQTRRHEIDLVLLDGYGIYCFEVKNWGGSISLGDDSQYWDQRKNNPEKNCSLQIQHLNPVNKTKRNCELLRNHLMRAGICLTANKFFPRVILTNATCDIDDAICNDPHVVTSEKLPQFAQNFSKTLLTVCTDPLIPYFFRGQLSYTQMEQVRLALNQIGTWDVLQLNGGKQLVGDFKGCTEISCTRKDVEELVFHHQRNATSATLWAIVGYAPTVVVTMYKRGGSGWFTRETTGTATLPYNHDISFRVAGESADAKIPANDINKILLSS